MAGRHRKISRRRSFVARRAAPGLTTVAVGATSVSTALMTGTTTAVAPVAVDLMALITPASSTSQIFAGTTYYGTDWTQEGYGPQQLVPFFLGPQAIADAIEQNRNDPRGNVVLGPGWGAGQTATALGILQANPDPTAEDSLDLVILDNNTNRAGGGFWTTYWMFAPLLATSAEPTPDDLTVPVLDVAYEYNINSNAPTYPINLLADLNSLVAYLYDYGRTATTEIPEIDINGDPLQPRMHYVVKDGEVVEQYKATGNITYVTVKSDGLPLLRPLRLIPGGDIIADALEPTLTELVNAGYQDNKPIPDDPGVTRPVGLFPPKSKTTTDLDGLRDLVQTRPQKGAATAQDETESPGDSVTKRDNETRKQPLVSSLPSLPDTTSATKRVDTSGGNKVFPGSRKTKSTTSSDGEGGVKQVADTLSSAIDSVTDSLEGDAQKSKTTDATSSTPDSPGTAGP